ncbi:MAG: HlyD family type I secretion periplasmic adaptor subunit [Henriciella sp.]
MTFWQLIRGDLTIGVAFAVCFSAVVGFGSWASLAPLAEGIVAYGRVEVDADRLIIQHLEGGIIEDIQVAEGDEVKVGQSLLTLTNVAARSDRNQLAARLATARASLRRVQALLDDDAVVDFEFSDILDLTDVERQDIIARQFELFEQQKQSRAALLAPIARRRQSFQASAASLAREMTLLSETIRELQAELEIKRGLFERGLMPRDAVFELEREESALESRIASLQTNLIQAESGAAESSLEYNRTALGFVEELGTERLALEQDVSELSERYATAADVVQRTTIKSPGNGTVLNLNYTTEGGVVGPGIPIMELVPEATSLYAVLEVRPVDRDAIKQGLLVDLRLSGIDSWRTEPLKGEITTISADLKSSPDDTYNYYEARVQLSSDELAGLEDTVLPGVPVEVFIRAGNSRTLLAYMVEPLMAVMRRGGRE